MTVYKLAAASRAPVYYAPTYKPIAQQRPVQIDSDYFDRLAVFGLACLAAAVVGRLVMGSLRR